MENKSNNLISSMVTWLIVLLPILRNYRSGISGINLAELLIGIMILIIIIKKTNKSFVLKLDNKHQILMGLLVLILVISLIDFCFVDFKFVDFISLYLRFGFYIIALIIFSNYLDIKKGSLILKKSAIICCILLIVQLILFYVFHNPTALKLPFLQLDKSSIYTGIFVKNVSGLKVLRAASLFLEPAHFGYYVTIALAVELFLSKSKNIILSIFYTLCVVLSTSSGGILLCSMVWIYYFICNFGFKTIIRIAIILSLLLIIYKFLSNSFFLNFIINKITAIFSEETPSSIRISSIDYIRLLDTRSKIMGIGFGNAEYYFNNLVISFGYTSSLAGLVIWNGIIGCIGLVYSFFRIAMMTVQNGRIFVYILLISLIGTSMLTSVNVIYFLVWALAVKRNNNNEVVL